MKICILYGGLSSEREISISSAKSIHEAILNDHNIEMYDFIGDYSELLRKVKNVDLVFNALHGGDGEDGTVQKFLEQNQIKFTGSNSNASKIAMNKVECKEICAQNTILTPSWELYDGKEISLRLPYVIKPCNEGSSIGLSIVKDNKLNAIDKALEKCLKVTENILIEEYIYGREVTVGVLNGEALPVIEILPKGDFYNYKCKYTKGQCNYQVPALLTPENTVRLQHYSVEIHNLLNCGPYSRVDFRISNNHSLKNQIFFLEINTLPGFTSTSLFPKAAYKVGINYRELINLIIKLSV